MRKKPAYFACIIAINAFQSKNKIIPVNKNILLEYKMESLGKIWFCTDFFFAAAVKILNHNMDIFHSPIFGFSCGALCFLLLFLMTLFHVSNYPFKGLVFQNWCKLLDGILMIHFRPSGLGYLSDYKLSSCFELQGKSVIAMIYETNDQ